MFTRVVAVRTKPGKVRELSKTIHDKIIRLWIMLRDEIDYEEFCRRGKWRQSGEAHAGMPDNNSGPALQ